MAESEWRKNFSPEEVKSVLEMVLYENIKVFERKNVPNLRKFVKALHDADPVCFLVNFKKVILIIETRK
jgi:hypothetical protein